MPAKSPSASSWADRVDLDRDDAAVLAHQVEAQDLRLGRVGRDALPALGRDVHRRGGDDVVERLADYAPPAGSP